MPCLPVKIINKEWADKLQEGSVFMRSLYDYGSWSVEKRFKENDTLIKNGVQGDIGEGIIRKVDLRIGDDFYNSFSSNLKSVTQDFYYIDQERFQFYKFYCMYGLTYMINEEKFEKPNERIREFGDTAVIIYNPNEFLSRFLYALYYEYGDNINFRLDEVFYYPKDYYGYLDEFCKSEYYSWQNEIRMRVTLLDKNNSILDDNGCERKLIIQNVNPIVINIGQIKDISIQIPIDDLINLRIPEIIKLPV